MGRHQPAMVTPQVRASMDVLTQHRCTEYCEPGTAEEENVRAAKETTSLRGDARKVKVHKSAAMYVAYLMAWSVLVAGNVRSPTI